MSQLVTLELPDEVAQNVRSFALRTKRRLEDVLLEWIDSAATELPVEYLADEQILALCDGQLEERLQTRLSDLLAANREGRLELTEQAELDRIMAVYRRGLVRKAQALKVAVERRLRPPLN